MRIQSFKASTGQVAAGEERSEALLEAALTLVHRFVPQSIESGLDFADAATTWIPVDQIPERKPVMELSKFSLPQQRLDDVERLGGCEIEDGAWHRGHRYLILRGDLVGWKRFVVSANPIPGSALDGIGDIYDRA